MKQKLVERLIWKQENDNPSYRDDLKKNFLDENGSYV